MKHMHNGASNVGAPLDKIMAVTDHKKQRIREALFTS